ncbi:MAG: PEGA domain-containing protein [Bacteroidota bacterium]
MQGHFQLYDVVPGLKEIIIYKEGYALYRSFMNLQAARNYNINIALKPLAQS